MHLLGLFFLSQQLGLEVVHFALLGEQCEMQAQALFFLLLQFSQQSPHLLHELPAIRLHLMVDGALYLLLNSNILADLLAHELHHSSLKFFYSAILEPKLLLPLTKLLPELLELPFLP